MNKEQTFKQKQKEYQKAVCWSEFYTQTGQTEKARIALKHLLQLKGEYEKSKTDFFRREG